jgi:hypothetical protein
VELSPESSTRRFGLCADCYGKRNDGVASVVEAIAVWRRAKWKRVYDANPEGARERARKSYAKNREKRLALAREKYNRMRVGHVVPVPVPVVPVARVDGKKKVKS